jgi:hypothetical protein
MGSDVMKVTFDVTDANLSEDEITEHYGLDDGYLLIIESRSQAW